MIVEFPKQVGLAPMGEKPSINSRHPAAEKTILHKRAVPNTRGAIWQTLGAVNGGGKDGYGSRQIFNFMEMLVVSSFAGALIYGGFYLMWRAL